MKLATVSFSLGKEGRPNEDSCGFEMLGQDVYLAALADGVGGNIGGATASKMAVQCFIEKMREDSTASFVDVFAKIVDSFVAAIARDASLGEMATTLTCIKIDQGILQFGHVGDSRIYHLRNNGIQQKTFDQTEAALLLEQGFFLPNVHVNITEEQCLPLPCLPRVITK